MTMLLRALAVLSSALLVQGRGYHWTFAPDTFTPCMDSVSETACVAHHTSRACTWLHGRCESTYVVEATAQVTSAWHTGLIIICVAIAGSILACFAACFFCCCRQDKQVVVVQQQQQQPAPHQYPPQQGIPVEMGNEPQQGVAIEMEDEPACNPSPCQPSCQTRV